MLLTQLPEPYIISLILELGYPEILNLRLLCSKFERVCNDKYLWNLLLQIYYNDIIKSNKFSDPKLTYIILFNVIKTQLVGNKKFFEINVHALQNDDVDLYKLCNTEYITNLNNYWENSTDRYYGKSFKIYELFKAIKHGSLDIATYILQDEHNEFESSQIDVIMPAIIDSYRMFIPTKSKSVFNLLISDTRFSKASLLQLTAQVGDILFTKLINVESLTGPDLDQALNSAARGNQPYIVQLLLDDHRITSKGIICVIMTIMNTRDKHNLMPYLLYNDKYNHDDLALTLSTRETTSELLLSTLDYLIKKINRETLNRVASNFVFRSNNTAFHHLLTTYGLDPLFENSLIIRNSSAKCGKYVIDNLVTMDIFETCLLNICNYGVKYKRIYLVRPILNDYPVSDNIIRHCLEMAYNDKDQYLFELLYNKIQIDKETLFRYLSFAVKRNFYVIMNCVVLNPPKYVIDVKSLINIALDKQDLLAGYLLSMINNEDLKIDEIEGSETFHEDLKSDLATFIATEIYNEHDQFYIDTVLNKYSKYVTDQDIDDYFEQRDYTPEW